MAQRTEGEMAVVGPAILTSGYLTKRTRTFLHWKRRWWQLLDNGTLLYFENQDRMKLLGELDIMKTCYDVRLGAEHCRVPFPRLVPSGCCFSFSVLKRTYYVFSPTAAEAKRWVECMTSVSAILNRRQSAFESSLSSIPLPTRGYGGSGPPSSEHKKKSNRRLMRRPGAIDKGPKPAGPEASASKHHTVTGPVEYQRTREPEDKLSESLVFTQKPVHHKHTAGSTQTRHDNSEAKSPVQYKRSVPDSKLWLDGSPSPRVVPESALSQPTSSPSEIQKSPKYRDHSAMFSSCDHSLHLRGSASASPLHHGATLPRPQIKRKASYQPLPTAALAMHFQRLQHREAVIRRGLAMMEPPRRPGSVDFTTSLPHSYYLPSRPQLPAQAHSRHHHYCNTSEMLARSGRRRSGDRIPPIVKPKPILKSPKGSLTPTQQMEFAAATHATSECSSTSGSSVDLAYHRYHHLRSRSSPGPVASIRESSPDSPTSEPQLGLMPPPPLTGPPPSRPPPPPPPNSPPPPNALEFLEPSPVSLATPQADQPSKQTAAARDRSISERKSPLTREWETNNWALHELRKLIFAIKHLGKPVDDKGRAAVTFQKLIEGTSGVFEALLGTLLAAKKHQIVDFEGDILLKGRDDAVVITLLREL